MHMPDWRKPGQCLVSATMNENHALYDFSRNSVSTDWTSNVVSYSVGPWILELSV